MTTDENDTCEGAVPETETATDGEIDLGERKTDPSVEPVGEMTNPEAPLPGDTEPPTSEPATDPSQLSPESERS